MDSIYAPYYNTKTSYISLVIQESNLSNNRHKAQKRIVSKILISKENILF